MSFVISLSVSALGYYFYVNKENVFLNLLKGYTYFDEKIKYLSYNPNLEVLDEINVCNENDDVINKIMVFKYKNKTYREILDINQKSEYINNPELLDNFVSPILACTVDIFSNDKLIESEKDITEYFNSFILPTKRIDLNEDNKIWVNLITNIFHINNDLDTITIEFSIVDDSATFYKNKNILIEMKDSKLLVVC
jgi:hypothetical protein